MPISTRLYSVLDVNAKASHDEIKKAYHKAAVRYHPDRQGGEASEAKFKEVQGAYEILSDPDKRKIYDRFGEKGLILMSQGGERAATFGALDASFIGCFFCTASAPLILFLIFVCLRVDGHTDWEWKNQPSQRGYLMYVFWVGFDVIRLPIFVGLLAGKLSGDLDASWFVVGIPYFIQFSLMVLTEIVNSCISPAGFRAELGPLVAKIIGMVFMFSTFFLVIAKAAGGDYSLAAAFTPVWAVIGCGCCI
eukprot:gene6601-10100_t